MSDAPDTISDISVVAEITEKLSLFLDTIGIELSVFGLQFAALVMSLQKTASRLLSRNFRYFQDHHLWSSAAGCTGDCGWQGRRPGNRGSTGADGIQLKIRDHPCNQKQPWPSPALGRCIANRSHQFTYDRLTG